MSHSKAEGVWKSIKLLNALKSAFIARTNFDDATEGLR